MLAASMVPARPVTQSMPQMILDQLPDPLALRTLTA
jgi:hypothetical protein